MTFREALRVLLEKTEGFDDEGPMGEGWQSNELRAARERVALEISDFERTVNIAEDSVGTVENHEREKDQ